MFSSSFFQGPPYHCVSSQIGRDFRALEDDGFHFPHRSWEGSESVIGDPSTLVLHSNEAQFVP